MSYNSLRLAVRILDNTVALHLELSGRERLREQIRCVLSRANLFTSISRLVISVRT